MASSILLHSAAEALDPGSGPARYALDLAAAFGATFKALVFQLDVSAPRTTSPDPSWAGPNTDLEERNKVALDRAEGLKSAALAAGVTADIVTTRSYAYAVPHQVSDQARLCDYTVLGVNDSGLLSERLIAEYVLFQSGAPVIVVPRVVDGAFACRRITIAWDYGRAAARAVRDAMPLLRRATDVTLLTVGGDKAFDSSLSSAQVVAGLHRRGVAVQLADVEREGRAIGDVIQEHAVESGSQLLVMGGYGHSRFREFVLGGATRQVLDAPRLPTLLSH